MADIRTKLCGIELDNPVIAASGSFGYGKEFEEFYDINSSRRILIQGNYV